MGCRSFFDNLDRREKLVGDDRLKWVLCGGVKRVILEIKPTKNGVPRSTNYFDEWIKMESKKIFKEHREYYAISSLISTPYILNILIYKINSFIPVQWTSL